MKEVSWMLGLAGLLVMAGTSGAPAVAEEISPEYLTGKWCYAYLETGGERQVEQVTYEFSADGRLSYRGKSKDGVAKEGSWSLQGDSLEVRPSLMFLPREVLTVAPDHFVLGNEQTKLHFNRGACP